MICKFEIDNFRSLVNFSLSMYRMDASGDEQAYWL